MDDLKMIDELLCLYVKTGDMTWEDVESDSNLSYECMVRLRLAWHKKEPKSMTLSLHNYFKKEADRFKHLDKR